MRWWFTVSGHFWTAPNTLLGLVAGLLGVAFGARPYRYHGALGFRHMPCFFGALTLGGVILHAGHSLDVPVPTYTARRRPTARAACMPAILSNALRTFTRLSGRAGGHGLGGVAVIIERINGVLQAIHATFGNGRFHVRSIGPRHAARGAMAGRPTAPARPAQVAVRGSLDRLPRCGGSGAGHPRSGGARRTGNRHCGGVGRGAGGATRR